MRQRKVPGNFGNQEEALGGRARQNAGRPFFGSLANAIDRLVNVVERICVAETQKSLAVLAEARAVLTCHSGFVQQMIGNLL